MTRVLFVGDTHGDLDFLSTAFQCAWQEKCQGIFQVGDFGFLWPGTNQMREVNELARHWEMPLYWIDGNHDWHPEIRKRFPVSDFIDNGPGVYHVRRGRSVNLYGLRICGLGGAPSIDRGQRTAGHTWWPEEVISEADLENVPSNVSFDVLAIHDAPMLPAGFRKTGRSEFDELVMQGQQKICQAIDKTDPSLIIHGHWHQHYHRNLGERTLIGLDCNTGRLTDAMIIVEKIDGRVNWMPVKGVA